MSLSSAERISTETTATEASLFVINLCASTTPMALVHPSNPELKRYTFFVTRQREEGRERFRLHMGYFASLFEAETLLAAVRDVYPAAWAGPAPTNGAPRKGRAATPVPGTQAVPAAAAATTPAAPVAAAAPSAAPATPPAPVVASAPAAPAPRVAPAAVTTSAPKAASAVIPEVEPLSESTTLASMSNVGDVLLQLSDRAPAAPLPRLQPPAALIPTLSESQTLRVLEPAKAAPPPPPAPAVVQKPPVKAPPAPAAKASPAAPSMPLPEFPQGDQQQVRVMTPEDTQTLRDIRLDAERNAPPCFAVQLLWSVSPINIVDHPHLAIFDAYTLYNVEGNRQGRKWYGVRLGFFSDPNAATQVAYYIRPDYPTVAVVPVAERERDRAGGNEPGAGGRSAAPAAPAPKLQTETSVERQGLDGFELLKDDRPVAVKRDVDDRPAVPVAKAAPSKPAPKPAAKAGSKPTGKRVMVRKPGARRTPGASMPLEETLEILGASTLTLDESREIINDSAIRTPVSKKGGSGGRLSRLLNRLGRS